MGAGTDGEGSAAKAVLCTSPAAPRVVERVVDTVILAAGDCADYWEDSQKGSQ